MSLKTGWEKYSATRDPDQSYESGHLCSDAVSIPFNVVDR